jgi:hypothetical protein
MNQSSLDEPVERVLAPERPWQRSGGAGANALGDWKGALLDLIPNRTRKALRKTIRKMVKRHGPELIAAVTTGIATSLLAAGANRKKKKKKKSKR